jgi:hypothetical protein
MNLEGDINEIQLTERLVDLWREQFTGAIRFENDGIIKIIYFKGGDVLSASTNDRADSIDEILMRAGKVSREHVKQALAKRKENETLGDALLNLGFITRKELTWARRVQVVGVIRSIAAWQTGSFTIVADYLPKRDEGTLFPLPQILVELVVTEADRQRFERAMDGGAAVFVKSGDFDDVFRRLGLNDEADTIVGHIDGSNTAAEVALASGKDTFNVYKLLDALAMLRILQRGGKPQATSELSLDHADAFSAAGVADAADMWNDDAPAVEIGGPQFQLDEAEAFGAPTLEIPALSMPPESDYQPKPYQPIEAPVVPAVTDDAEPMWSAEPEPAAWDETPLDPVVAPRVAAAMPSWDSPTTRKVEAAPAPPPMAPPAEGWGFDEAQLEAVRRAEDPAVASTATAAAPMRGKAVQPRRAGRYGLLVALMVIFILGAAGYFGFQWWQKQQDAQIVVQQPVRRPPRPQPVEPVPTATIAEAPITDTAITTTTVEPPAGLTVTSAPPPATATIPPATASVAPAPVIPTPTPVTRPAVRPVTPAAAPAADANDPLRARYDAMARDFAASPAGNYTVQFAIFCQPGSVANAIKSGGGKVWFVKYGARCYQAYYGNFETRDEAVAALRNLPRSLQDANAKVLAIAR